MRWGEGENKLIFQQWQIVTMDESIGNFNMGEEQKEGSGEGGLGGGGMTVISMGISKLPNGNGVWKQGTGCTK